MQKKWVYFTNNPCIPFFTNFYLKLRNKNLQLIRRPKRIGAMAYNIVVGF